MDHNSVPGKNASIASLVCGILAVVLWFFGYSAILSVILGVAGIVLAGSAKKVGYDDGLRVAGLVLSIIGLIGGAIAVVACVACAGCASCALTSGYYYSY